MRNDALAAALRATELTAETLAKAAAVAPKTVRRWLADDTVVPHPETRARVEKLLAVSAGSSGPSAPSTMPSPNRNWSLSIPRGQRCPLLSSDL